MYFSANPQSAEVAGESVVMSVNVEQAENQLEMSAEVMNETGAQSAEVAVEQATEQTRITAADISPLPHADPATRSQTKRRAQGTLVLTSSPNVVELKEKLKTKRETKMRQEGMTGQTSSRNKSAKTKLQLGVAKQKQAKACDNETNPPKTKKSKQTTNDATDDASCLYCCEKWSCSRSRDPWIRCTECLKWAHCACAGVKRTAKTFQCDLC